MPFSFNPFRKFHKSRMSDPDNPATRFPKQHEYGQQVQKGLQGSVHTWTHRPSATVIAVKVVQNTKPKPNEVKLLRDLPTHKSIIGYLGYCEKRPAPHLASILLEYCPHGDLFMVRSEAIKKNMQVFSEAFMWAVYSQLMGALAFLHEGVDDNNPMGHDNWKPVVHRDIKIENVLVKSLGKKSDWSDIDLKLCDLGMAGYHDPANPNPRGYIGTTQYWPPEVKWETRRHTPASDVWGIATIIHELAHGFSTFVDPNITKAAWFARNDKAPYPETWSETHKGNFWISKALRRVVPINLEPDAAVPILSDPYLGHDEDAIVVRKRRPSPKYSDALNDCMLVGLAMSPEERPGSGELLGMIDGGHSDFIFQSLSREFACETASTCDDSDEEIDC
ncbi:kinase-like protein [Stemphylium lycopersici]|nr:serine threonine protein kinase [Stemphylium lycopersici]RAR01287.1 kinase-like protein [Stemphylium lycopersici]